MALVTFNFESKYIGFNQGVSVILPDKPWDLTPREFYESGKKYKVLWLLHGTGGDHTDWIRKSNIEIYAAEKQLIVVMPSGFNADYTNWPGYANGLNMGDFLTEELMPMIHNWLPASDKPEDNFIAGLSMGGRGVMKYLLDHPEKFAAGAVLSAAPRDLSKAKTEDDLFKDFMAGTLRAKNQFANAGGFEGFLASGENAWDRITKMHKAGTLPKMLFACGKKDFLYKNYMKFKKYCLAEQIPVEFFELPKLSHEWRFWDASIQKALEFFGL